MANSKDKISVKDVPRLLATLNCGSTAEQQQTLRMLCPCRNRVYDRGVWLEIFRTYDRASMAAKVRGQKTYEMVQNQAAHAIETLREHARTDARARELLDWLIAQGVDTQTNERPRPPRQEREKVTWRDVPHLLETLECDDPEAQQHTLQLLCPCRNRRYDQDVWLAIFQAYENGLTGGVRDQAGHAIETLRTRARTDPRSQELIRRLAEQGLQMPALEEAVPTWQPNLRGNGLYIPRFERSPRSRANRRRK